MYLAILWLILTCLFIFIRCTSNAAMPHKTAHTFHQIHRTYANDAIYAMGINFHFHGKCKSLLAVGVGIYCALLSVLLLLFKAPTIHSRIQADASHPHRPMLCKKILLMMNRRLLVGGFFLSPFCLFLGGRKVDTQLQKIANNWIKL